MQIPNLQPQDIKFQNKTFRQSLYRIEEGDTLLIKFYFNSDLNDKVTVRSDGKITLQLIDEMQAAGLTIEQLDDALTSAYAKYLKTSSSDYALSVGDKLSIRSYYYDKLNDTVIVRPDGKISLQLIDEVNVAGLTPAKLDQLLTEKYSTFLESPDISINVLNFNQPELSVAVTSSANQKIYVGGEVKRPGLITTPGNIRVLDAIIQSAGVLDSGDLAHVILIRRGLEDEPSVFTMNVEHIIQGQSPDLWLTAYDIIYIPKSGIANVEQYLRTHLWDLLSDRVVFSFLYNWDRVKVYQ